MANLPALSYFDPTKKTRLIADASPIALVAVLLQIDKQQVPKVIYFVRKSLSDAKRRYSQTKKESLAFFGVGNREVLFPLGRTNFRLSDRS